MVHRGSTDDIPLLQISSGVVWQTRYLQLSRNMSYLLSPRLCFFIDLFVYCDDSLTSERVIMRTEQPTNCFEPLGARLCTLN